MPSRSSSRRSRRGSRRSRRAGRGEKVSHSPRKRATPSKQKKEKQLTDKTLAELQMVARSHGIPFGGLSRTQLMDKIIAYR
jgi:hypothetical protein